MALVHVQLFHLLLRSQGKLGLFCIVHVCLRPCVCMYGRVQVRARFQLICSRGADPIVCTPLGDKMSLLYGLQKQDEAYLLPTSRSRGYGLNQSINQ